MYVPRPGCALLVREDTLVCHNTLEDTHRKTCTHLACTLLICTGRHAQEDIHLFAMDLFARYESHAQEDVRSIDMHLFDMHRKTHLFDIDIPGKITFKESTNLSPGDSLTVVDTEVGRLGIGICYDLRSGFSGGSQPLQVILCGADRCQWLTMSTKGRGEVHIGSVNASYTKLGALAHRALSLLY
eukprot:292160-Pelagomonas_calceolata.AAC.5